MDTLSAAHPPTRPNGPSLWKWLLRSVGLETWFHPHAAAQPAREERVFLRLILPGVSGIAGKAGADLLNVVLRECLPAVRTGGGEVASHQSGSLLLTWPAETGQREVVPTYFQLRERLRRQARHQELFGAASLGWVTPRSGRGRRQYRGEVLTHVAGMLRENQQLGHDLLVSAALHHRLDYTLPFRYDLHVGFNLPGHRYPATLFRVTPELPSEPTPPSFTELVTATPTGKVSSLPYL